MRGQTVILRGSYQRKLAHELVDGAPMNAVLNIREQSRSVDQNAKMWAMLSDVSRASPEGRKWTTDVWKAAFMDFLGHEIQWYQGLNGEPFPTQYSSKKLNKSQMSDLITCIYEYGDRHGVMWSEPGGLL